MEKSNLRSLLSFLESFSQCFHPYNNAEIHPLDSSTQPNPPTYDLLNLFYSQCNLKENVTSSHYRQYLLPFDSKEPISKLSSFPQSEAFSFVSYSPKRTYKAVLQSFPDKTDKLKKRNTLEIYTQDSLIRSLNLDEFHEGILNNCMVGTPLVWNANETKLAYIAELKPAKKSGYFDSYNPLDDKELELAGKNYRYEPDYGEKFNGIKETSIFIYDMKENQLNQVILPYQRLLPSYPDFTDAEGNNILFSGFLSDDIKLGIIYCVNRASKIYHIKPKLKLLFPKPKEKPEESVKIMEKPEESAKIMEKSEESTDKTKEKLEETCDLKDLSPLVNTYEICFRPLLSPNRKKIAYFGSPLKPPHLNILALHVYDLETNTDQCIIPIIEDNIFLTKPREEINKNLDSFSGIASYHDDLDKTYWLTDSKHIIFQSVGGFEADVFLVDTESKGLTKLTPKLNNDIISTNWSIITKDPFRDVLILGYENMKNGVFPKTAILTNLNEIIQEKLQINQLNEKTKWTILENNTVKSTKQRSIEDLFLSKFKETLVKFGEAEGVLWSLEGYDRFSEQYYEYFPCEKPQNLHKAETLKPLIVGVHGGPHANCTGLTKLRIFLLLRGYNLLLTNFTGSCGYGQKHIEKLMGKIGKLDVDEVVGMIKSVITEKQADPERIIVMGGSYGGYLSGIFATHPQYSSIFKAAILLNPVVNIPFMEAISDISDWCSAVSLSKQLKWHLEAEDIRVMYEQSPISKHCNIPCLLLLGVKDRRVPYQASIAFRNKAIAEGGKIETFIYQESDHELAESVKAGYDIMVRILSFIANYVDN